MVSRPRAVASMQSNSYIMLAPTKAVIPVGSQGGEISTTSAPAMLRPLNPRTKDNASRLVKPPTSGVPVPGANAGINTVDIKRDIGLARPYDFSGFP